jgi:hypothetical protein
MAGGMARRSRGSGRSAWRLLYGKSNGGGLWVAIMARAQQMAATAWRRAHGHRQNGERAFRDNRRRAGVMAALGIKKHAISRRAARKRSSSVIG